MKNAEIAKSRWINWNDRESIIEVKIGAVLLRKAEKRRYSPPLVENKPNIHAGKHG